MGVNLHRLRGKIATAAIAKFAAWRLSHLPGGAKAVSFLADTLDPAGATEPTASYRGLAAEMLRDVLPHAPCHAHQEPEPAEPETATSPRMSCDPVAGLVPQRRRASEQQQDTAVHHRQARAAADPTPGNLLALAAAYRKPHTAQYSQALTAYQRAYEANPHDLRAVEGVLNTGARSRYDWPEIYRHFEGLKPHRGRLATGSAFWRAVDPLFTQEPTEPDIGVALAALDQHHSRLAQLHQLVLEAISDRLQFLGEFRAGVAMRRIMAENRVRELRGIPLESALWLKHLAGAQTYLGDDEAAAQTVTRPRLAPVNETVKLQVRKLRADVALFTGDPEPLRQHMAERAADCTVPGEQQMRALVEGQRIAVVGPADTAECLGELIDSYDVVIRTRFQPEFVAAHSDRVGTRTDIAYYSGRDLTGMFDDLGPAAEAGELQLAVARPFYLSAIQQPPAWLRFNRTEFGLYFRGAPLATQRIIYDLLPFEPAEIGLFHVDFFTGSTPFAGGYRDEQKAFGPFDAMNDLVMMHDLAFEFRFTQRLHQSGLVTPYGTVAQILELTEQQYLRRLEEQSPLGRS